MFSWFKKTSPVPEKAARADNAFTTSIEALAATSLPNEYATHKKCGNAFLAQGRLQEAAECYRQAVAVNPGFAEGLLNLGFVSKELRLHEDAVRYLQQAVQIDPAMADAYFLLGCIAQASGNPTGAIEHLKKALELKPDFSEAHATNSKAFMDLGNIGKAMDHYRKARGQ
jgi:protein O-GlcNAc transferase